MLPTRRNLSAEAVAPLLKSEARCMALLTATDAIVWTIDPERGFIEPQPSWQAYTGQTWERAAGQGWVDAVHPDDRDALLRGWSLAVVQGGHYDGACRLYHQATGQFRQCVVRANPVSDADGRITEWVGTVTDVHDRPLSLDELLRMNDALTHQLQAQHEDLLRLFSVSLDVMVTLDQSGRLLSVSPSFEHVSGVPAAEATGQVFERFLHPDDVQRTWNEVRRVLGGQHAIDFETRLLHADGSLRVVSWRAVGAVIEQRLYAVGRDITEQKRAGERVARAQRLEALGQLTGGIAHDFNNILAAVLSYLEVGKLMADNPAAVAQALASAERAARRGAALVTQVMGFARQQQLSLRPVDLNGVLGGLADMLQRTLGAQVGLTLELQPQLFSVTADPTQVEMVVLNLGINARDAMPHGGQLTVRTFRHAITEDPSTRIDDLPRGDYACLAVLDTGMGMDATTLAHCFEPFYSTKGPGQGTGLGLSQVLGVVQQCGGAVLVRSREGQGTSVYVYLPRAHGEPARADAELPRAAPPSLPSATVLVVDDNPDVVASTVQLLELVGFTALPARGPEEAMEILLSGRPMDVLLTDYAMPGMSGLDLVRDALRNRPKLSAVIVTGFDEFPGLRGEFSGVTLLRKPFELAQLVEAIQAAVSTHRLHTGEH